MKKIQLSDGQPTDISFEDVSIEGQGLCVKIKDFCIESGLSYVEINKALYLADKELYFNAITKRRDD